MGRNQIAVLNFAKKQAGNWVSYNPKCKSTVSAVFSLSRKGVLLVNKETQQFKI